MKPRDVGTGQCSFSAVGYNPRNVTGQLMSVHESNTITGMDVNECLVGGECHLGVLV